MTWQAIIYAQASRASANPISPREGIDFFAYICRHEERHRLDLIGFWGANSDVDEDRDKDINNVPGSATFGQQTGDHIPDELEANLPDAPRYEKTLRATYMDTFGYTGPNPQLLPDMEDYCLRRQQPWKNGDADKLDWAFPGKQWWDGTTKY